MEPVVTLVLFIIIGTLAVAALALACWALFKHPKNTAKHQAGLLHAVKPAQVAAVQTHAETKGTLTQPVALRGVKVGDMTGEKWVTLGTVELNEPTNYECTVVLHGLQLILNAISPAPTAEEKKWFGLVYQERDTVEAEWISYDPDTIEFFIRANGGLSTTVSMERHGKAFGSHSSDDNIKIVVPKGTTKLTLEVNSHFRKIVYNLSDAHYIDTLNTAATFNLFASLQTCRSATLTVIQGCHALLKSESPTDTDYETYNG